MKRKKRTFLKSLLIVLAIPVLFIVVLLVNLLITGINQSKISVGTPISSNGNSKSALLIIDIQESTTGALSMQPFFVERSGQLIADINLLADSFKTAGLPVIYVRSEITNPLINILNNSFAKGSKGAQNDSRLNIVSDLEVVKSTKDAFRNNMLDSLLIKNDVNELYIAGLDAAECVDATMEAALNRKYRITVIRETVISKSEILTDSMMKVFNGRGVRVKEIESFRLTE